MVWPTLGSRTAKEQNRTVIVATNRIGTILRIDKFGKLTQNWNSGLQTYRVFEKSKTATGDGRNSKKPLIAYHFTYYNCQICMNTPAISFSLL